MKGRAFELLQGARKRWDGEGGAFRIAHLIMLARIIPSRVTPDLDDKDIEQRLAQAIEHVSQLDESPGSRVSR
jgi:hypothetical protein